MFTDFHARGLNVIPLKDGRPMVEWGRYMSRLPDPQESAGWSKWDEYGLICGEVSGVVALDIDTNDTALIYAMAGPSTVRKVGSKGFTAFYKYAGERTAQWKDGGQVICEVLSDKKLTTIPPSLHRTTRRPYVWLEDALGDVELPTLQPMFYAMMDARYPRPIRTQPLVPYDMDQTPPDIVEAERMLSYLSPDVARDEWVNIGMALADEYGDLACNLWHNWSSASPKYNNRDAQSAWRSFTGSGVTIGTLIHLAKQNGYAPPSRHVEYVGSFEVDMSYIFDKPADPAATIKPRNVPIPAPVRIPGLVGDIADWITSTAIRPQPVLSLAAALTFVGAMKGHRVRGHTDLRTNLMCLAMAPTAAGKEHPQKSIDALAELCGVPVMGRPTSGTGLLTGLNKAGGVGLLTVDEMGRYIGNITMRSSQGYQREIADYMVELFSSASRKFRGRQYADEKTNPQIVIDQPHFCCIGSTVPEKLQSACSSSEVIDGFLNRWLVFSADDRPAKQKGIKFSPPPADLVDRVRAWMDEHPVVKSPYGVPEPVEMRFTPEAWAMMEEFDAEMMRKLDSEPYPINQLYARSSEHAEKLAMVICDDLFIGTAEVGAAITIVNQSNKQIAQFAGSITDNQHEADVIYILEMIRKWPGISRGQLTQRTRRIPHRLRADILNQLMEAGEVSSVERNKSMYFSICSDNGL